MRSRLDAATLALLATLAAPALPGTAPFADAGSLLRAQEVAYRPLVLTLPANTQAMAMGDAFQFNGRISDLIFYNPALLDRARGIEGGAQRWATQSTSFTLSGATGWLSGGVGIGLQSLTYTVPVLGTSGRRLRQDLLVSGDEVPVSELVATGGISKQFQGLRFGLAVKLIEQRIWERRDGTAALDLGVAWVGDLVTVGFSAQNLGPDLTIRGDDYPLPRRFTLGGATQDVPVGPLDLSATAAIVLDPYDRWIPGAGLQVEWWPVVGRTFIARAGWRRVPVGEAWPFTFGAGFTGDQLGLDYAYQRFDGDVRGAHRLSVRWR